MAATAQTAAAVSQKLVEHAIAHIDSFLVDDKWLNNHRRIGTADRSFAYWVLPGIGMLTDSEKEQVRKAYADKGWRHIIFADPLPGSDANWCAEFQAMP